MAAREWLPQGVPVTRMVHVFDMAMAEYVLGYLLAVQLDIRRAERQQASKTWKGLGLPAAARRPRPWSWGSGASAARSRGRSRRTAWTVIGVSRTGQPVDGVDEVHTIDNLDCVLPRAQYLVLVVPLTPETRGMIDARRLAMLPGARCWSNICRGAVVSAGRADRDAAGRRVACAVLDVFEKEPLPPESPFWDDGERHRHAAHVRPGRRADQRGALPGELPPPGGRRAAAWDRWSSRAAIRPEAPSPNPSPVRGRGERVPCSPLPRTGDDVGDTGIGGRGLVVLEADIAPRRLRGARLCVSGRSVE